ncbi:nuclear transport factor 2 family protein [Mycobacterium avium]|uniref:nuclear transport factor 2 family protein n=1 Tax=Mycobacterium avium TaxID=1764 RepID=UPI000A033AF1|nr:nuclear transport factor 2 family protein [Mycobacterium avium]
MTLDTLNEIRSRLLIQDLVANYCHGMDKHDLDLFMALWHPEAEFLPGEPFGNFYGADEIRRAVTELVWPGLPRTRHWTVNLVVKIDGDQATGLADVIGSATTPDGVMASVDATYEDRYERRDGVWCFVRRRIVVHEFTGLAEDWTLQGGSTG